MMSPLQKVLDELNMSILPHDIRLNAIVEAAEHFDHRDKARHDYELHEGAARIIYQKLAFVLTLQLSNYNAGSSYNVVTSGLNAMGTSSSSTTSSFNTRSYHHHHHHHGNTSDPISIQKIRSTRSQEASDADYEIALLTTCLEMVHRASPNAIANTWFSIGEESLPILIKLLERPFCKIQSILEKAEKQHQSANTIEKLIATIATNKETKVAVQKVTKILAVYSLIPAAKLKMAKCPGFLSILVKITDTHNMNRMKSLRPVSKRLMANKTNIHNQNHQSDSNYYHNNSGNNTSGNNNNNSNLAASDDDRSIISQSTKLLNPIAPSTVEQPTNNTIPGISNTNNANTNINSSQISSGSNGIRGTTAGVGLYMTEASRFNSIAILTNLAAVEKNRLIMLSEPGLVNNIARVVHNERSDVARQCSALAIMNLSNGDREHVPELAGNDLLLEAIVKLTRDDLLETRRNAVIALFNVACADENTVKLVRYKDGVILDVLMQIVGSSNVSDVEDEMNEDVRTTAAEALFNISCSSIVETTDRFANHPNLLETCALVLKSHFLSREVKVYCAAILRRMAEIINFPKKSQLELLSALVKASSWTRTGCIASAFLSQAGVVENRKVMVEHHGLLTALSKLALVSGDGECDRIRSDAISTIEHLSREAGRVRETLSKHEGIMLAMTRASYNRRPSSSSSMYGMDEESSTETSRSTQLALKRLVEII
mmetsp:Transcript_24955/g.37315  ORF Transcript_24955/g.37315 Transcript_24955/m.37315 type:complete len:716 (-) Transcript_24955:1701-3848(-)